MKFEGTRAWGFLNAAIGMRLPMSKDFEDAKSKSDSLVTETQDDDYIGEKDLALMQKLLKEDKLGGGQPNSKFMRMIHVQVCITAPQYFFAELDTYKIGTVRNSSSFQHKGVSRRFTIDDFDVDEKIKSVLKEKQKECTQIVYPYETNEYRVYTTENGRKYEVYRNGRIFSCEFDCVDTYGSGRIRHFEKKEVIPSCTSNGYFELNLGGRNGEKWLLHRLVAKCWLDNLNDYETVDHIDSNKGNNCVENLEWVSREENIKREFENNLNRKGDLHANYLNWKISSKISPADKLEIRKLYEKGMSQKEIANKYEISQSQISVVIRNDKNTSENYELFEMCWYWENIIKTLNDLRDKYIETKDYNYFIQIRKLLPMGYLYTSMIDLNYATLRNIVHWRANHKLTEWHKFCDWAKTLPYAEELLFN